MWPHLSIRIILKEIKSDNDDDIDEEEVPKTTKRANRSAAPRCVFCSFVRHKVS